MVHIQQLSALARTSMIIAATIAIGMLVAWIAYRMLFYDFSDFMEGFGRFLTRRGPWPFPPSEQPPNPEDFEDEGWSSTFRLLVLVAVSVGCAYLTYSQLHKYFE